VQCEGGWLPLRKWRPRSLASNIRKITKEKQWKTASGELIAKLMNLSNQLAIELRFNESSLVLEVVGLLHSLPTIAEQNRNAWHPSFNTSGPSKGITYISTVKQNNE
jgi:hypothetical protein